MTTETTTPTAPALPVDAAEVRDLLQAVHLINRLHSKLAELDHFPVKISDTDGAIADLTTLLSEVLTQAAIHGDIPEADRMPEAVIIDGERFNITHWRNRGVMLSEYTGSPHGILLLPDDGLLVLGDMITQARDQIRVMRDSAESRGETWPRPEPVPAAPACEEFRDLIREVNRATKLTGTPAHDLVSALLDHAHVAMLAN